MFHRFGDFGYMVRAKFQKFLSLPIRSKLWDVILSSLHAKMCQSHLSLWFYTGFLKRLWCPSLISWKEVIWIPSFTSVCTARIQKLQEVMFVNLSTGVLYPIMHWEPILWCNRTGPGSPWRPWLSPLPLHPSLLAHPVPHEPATMHSMIRTVVVGRWFRMKVFCWVDVFMWIDLKQHRKQTLGRVTVEISGSESFTRWLVSLVSPLSRPCLAPCLAPVSLPVSPPVLPPVLLPVSPPVLLPVSPPVLLPVLPPI